MLDSLVLFFSFKLFGNKTKLLTTKKKDKKIAETVLLLLFGFQSYYICESYKLSGPISLFLFVIIGGNYANKLLSAEAVQGVDTLVHTGAFICEMMAILYLGVNSISSLRSAITLENAFISLFVIIGSALIRWISIGMPALLLICYDKIKLDGNEILLIWFGGLIRGSIALSLAFGFSEENAGLRNIVVFVSLATTLGLSSIVRVLTDMLGFSGTKSKEHFKVDRFVINKPLQDKQDEAAVKVDALLESTFFNIKT